MSLPGRLGVRVRWQCHTPACSEQVHEGSTWIPRNANEQETFFHTAVAHGLIDADDLPFRCRADPSTAVLVAFDDQPGRLSAHHRDELEYP